MRNVLIFLMFLMMSYTLAQSPNGTAVPKAAPAKAAEAKPGKAPLKITPGQVITPTDRQRRIWGELIAIDPQTRTGRFRNEFNDQVMSFTILPYAALYHHASFGDVQDYRIGERAIFRLHENEQGEWVWLSYIQDEMNMLLSHKEYYYVDAIDPQAKTITFTQANEDKSFIREKDLVMQTDAQTRFWKKGQPASFSDIKVGDRLRAKTRGVGQGRGRIAWEIFLDDESLLKFRDEQEAIHAKRMAEEGLPGYVDQVDGNTVRLTLFLEAMKAAADFKAGQAVRLAPAGVDRKPTTAPQAGMLKEIKAGNKVYKAVVVLDSQPMGLKPTELARLWRK